MRTMPSAPMLSAAIVSASAMPPTGGVDVVAVRGVSCMRLALKRFLSRAYKAAAVAGSAAARLLCRLLGLKSPTT